MKYRLLFPSPVFFDQPDGLDALRDTLRPRMLEAGDTQLFDHDEGPFFQLRQVVMEGLQAAISQQTRAPAPPSLSVQGSCRAVILQAGEYISPQAFPEAQWAGVFVVDAGESTAPPPAGCISFLDPRGAAVSAQTPGRSQSHDLVPVDGLLLLFPGWLVHHMHPYSGTTPRIVAQFTLTVQT